eukprot:gene2034-3112_t
MSRERVRVPVDDNASVLVSIRTGTNTRSECVGALHLRIDTTLRDVRQQLASLAKAAKKSRRRGSVTSEHGLQTIPSIPGSRSLDTSSADAAPQIPLPELTAEQRDKLSKMKLHAFDFSAPFQFVRRGGVLQIPQAAEAGIAIKDAFPILPNVGVDWPLDGFMLPGVDAIGLSPGEHFKKLKLAPELHSGELGDFFVALPALFVRQKTGDHSEKVIMERLLMQNNVFGRLQTPQQLGTLISKHNANAPDFLGRTVLQECAQEGNYYVVAFLLGLSFVDVEAADWKKQTALHLAVDRGHLEVVSLLLDAGANVLAQDATKRTPLHLALERRADVLAARLCDRLLANGVTHEDLAQYKGPDGRDPVQLFALLSPSFVELCTLGQMPALRALWSHYLFDRRSVLDKGMSGRTCLHEAADACQTAVVEFLFNDVHLQDSMADCLDDCQRSPLHLACRRGATGIVRKLVPYLDPNVVDCNLRTPLHVALLGKHAETAELLLAEVDDLNVNVLDMTDNTPLHVAAANNMHRCCELLLHKHNADASLKGAAAVFTGIKLPAIEVSSLSPAARAEYKIRRFRREKGWRLATWEFRKRDPQTHDYKRKHEMLPAQWAAVKSRKLSPKPDNEGGPIAKPKEIKGGPLLNW